MAPSHPHSTGSVRTRHTSLEPLEARIAPATIVVTTLADTIADDGEVSLREAMFATNTNAIFHDAPAGDLDGDHIVFAPGLSGTITLGLGPLFISDDLTIDGGGEITIDANFAGRLFNIDTSIGGGTNRDVAISHLTLQNGSEQFDAAGAGAILLQDSSLTLDDVAIENCSALTVGGAIHVSQASLTVKNSVFSNNSVIGNYDGGALFIEAVTPAGSTVVIQDTLFDHNSTPANGGAISNSVGTLTLTRVAFDHNTAISGGAIDNHSLLTYSTGVVSSNSASIPDGGAGGGLANADTGVVHLTAVDFVENTALHGGAIFNAGQVTIEGGLYSGNTATGYAGAIDNVGVLPTPGQGVLDISNAEFVGNQAPESGAIVNSLGTLTITNSVFHGNGGPDCVRAGALQSEDGSLTIVQSVFIDNDATSSGSNLIISGGTANIYNSTIAGGNVSSVVAKTSGTLSFHSTIVADNLDHDLVFDPGVTVNASHSLIEHAATPPNGVNDQNLFGFDPALGSLGHHGGQLPTINLMFGSPALDAGSNELSLSFDLRGAPFARTLGGATDIGAFETSDATVTIAANGKKATFRDVDGDLVTISTTAGTFIQSNFSLVSEGLGARLLAIFITDNSSFAGADLSLKAKRSALGGDGFTSLSILDAQGIDLGRVTIDGDLSSIYVGDSNTSTPGLLGLNVVSMGEFDGGATIHVIGALNALKVRTDLTSTGITVLGGPNAKLGPVKVAGSITAGDIEVDGSIASITVAGNILGTNLSAGGSIGSFTTTAVPGKFRATGGIVVKGSVISSDFGIAGDLANLRVSGEFQDTLVTVRGDLAPVDLLTAQTIGNLAIGGRVAHSDFLIGYDLNVDAVNPDVQVDKIIITGNWVDSNLAVGVEEGPDGFFGLGTDTAIAGGSASIVSRIASLTIKGHAYGTLSDSDDYFGIVAQEIAKARIGLANLPLTVGPGNDLTPLILGTSLDLAVREVALGV